MDKFLNFLKKFSKWIAVVVISFLLLIYVISEISQWRDNIASTVDEELGLECKSVLTESKDTKYRVLLGSSKNSRATNKYWENIRVVSFEKSEIFDDKSSSYFQKYFVMERTIDYVVARAQIKGQKVVVRLNRENYDLDIKIEDVTYYRATCEVVDAKEIYDFVDKENRESQERNIL